MAIRGIAPPMTMMTKICGLSSADAVSAARDGGATHLGFIFFEPSPRNIDPKKAAELRVEAGEAKCVAVLVDATDDFLDTIVKTMKPDMLQLHGSERPERIGDLQQRYDLPIIKALSVREPADIDKVRQYDEAADFLLLDARPPKGSDLPGGNGIAFDWSLVETLRTHTSILLSGGIDASNIESALARVSNAANSLAGIDLSSGVESAPGVKDDAKIKALLNIVRNHSAPYL